MNEPGKTKDPVKELNKGCSQFKSGCLGLILIPVGFIVVCLIGGGIIGLTEGGPPDGVVYDAVPLTANERGSASIKRASFPSDKYPTAVSEHFYPAGVTVYSICLSVTETGALGNVYQVYWIYFYKVDNRWVHSKPDESITMSSLDDALSKEPREP